MQTRVIYLMAFCMVLVSSSAFATNRVEVPGMNGIVYVHFDISDRQIGASVPPSSWYTISDSPELNVALSYAKEGQDTGAIPAPVSSRY